MGLSQKSKSVTWAPDINLCQVRLFPGAKPKTGTSAGANAQARPSRPLQPCGNQSNNEMPPGFHEIQPANLRPQISITKWRCPTRFEVNSEWKVVSGEESQEIETQNQRQMRELEAIYPGRSAIPPSPRELPEAVRESTPDDRNTPLIPVTPMEGEDEETNLSNGTHCSGNNTSHSAQALQPHIVAAALASVLSNNDRMNLIDHDLLLRILSNPQAFEQQNVTTPVASPKQYVPELPTNSSNSATTLNATTAAGPVHPPQLTTGFGGPLVKDMNYYKTLIHQHGGGGGRRDVPRQSSFGDDSRTRKIFKPCIYFRSLKGCRNGANCAYQHDTMSSKRGIGFITEVPSVKRVKLSR